MRRLPIYLALVMGLLVYLGCNSSADDPAGGNSSEGRGRGRNVADDNEQAEIDIVGEYTYRSELIGGGFESGVVTIARLGEAYEITMTPRRGNPYAGIAILDGNHLAVCYSFPAAGERGVGSFVVGDGGTLTGHWATLGSEGGLLADTWTPAQ